MDEITAEAEVWNIDPDLLRSPDDQDGVWPDNIEAVRAYLAICTQWCWKPMGMAGARAVGLDHGSAQAGFALAGIEITPELWERVRMIERGALDAMAESWS